MNATTMSSALRLPPADRTLRYSVRFWFLVMATGEIIFTLSTLSFYGGAFITGDTKALSRFMTHGYVSGDAIGNAIVGAHIICSIIINLGGLTQVVPQVRRHAPRWHRWVGRIYLLTAAGLSLAGLSPGYVRRAHRSPITSASVWTLC